MQENKRSKTVGPEIKITKKKKNAGGIEEPSLSTVITCHLLDVSFSDQIAVFFFLFFQSPMSTIPRHITEPS